MLGQTIAMVLVCFGIGAMLLLLAGLRTSPEIRRSRWLKFSGYFIIVIAVLGCASLGRSWLAALVVTITVAGIWEMRAASIRIRQNRRGPVWAIWSIYVLLTVGLFTTVLTSAPQTIGFLYLTVAAFDGFSEVTGHLCGRHPLAPAVSPGKTWEGLLGGEIGAVAVAVLLRGLSGLDTLEAVVLGAAIGVCALMGDLSASWVKRRAVIKDFSVLLPGQGGVLDRFDSFIGAGGILAPLLAMVAR